MDLKELIGLYAQHPALGELQDVPVYQAPYQVHISGLAGSSLALIAAAVFSRGRAGHWFVLPDRESAAYFLNDLESLFGELNAENIRKKVLFFPTSYRKSYNPGQRDNDHLLQRAEVLNRIGAARGHFMVVTYPEALVEKVVQRDYLQQKILNLKTGEKVDLDFVADMLEEFSFERVDFVAEPGQFALRGGIIDVFSFANEYPYRIEFDGDKIGSLRTFNAVTQLSRERLSSISLLPDVSLSASETTRSSLMDVLQDKYCWWVYDRDFVSERIQLEYEHIRHFMAESGHEVQHIQDTYIDGRVFNDGLDKFPLITWGTRGSLVADEHLSLNIQPQPSFNKNFELLLGSLRDHARQGIQNLIFTDNARQAERFYAIVEDIQARKKGEAVDFSVIPISLHEGFIDTELGLACFTDHQIFDRYHRFRLKNSYKSREALTIKELYNLQPGDYVTHIDHGVGRYDGLEKIENNGRQQEAMRIVYKNNDLLYVSIHSLHRISKYIGKEGTEPSLDKLGSGVWKTLKNKTKKKVKDIAAELIKLYAKRKSSEGYAFAPDTYLQHELEASFIYEDTPDQYKATQDVKQDMEASFPMDRLVCGDVGFGKTEVALRAAFKAVADSKQVALLVPTTILALQHYKTFRDRLKDFPCRVDYLNRFRDTKQQKQILKNLEEGKVDILIGTHRILSQDVTFKNLGLLIIDEEQKFGVAAKERLKSLKVNIDTLTLTATPIPRTLQFSLMGARDLSVINTPPPNRQAVQTELRAFGEEVIRDAIQYEVARGGQVFFIHNRVQNIGDVADMVRKFAPGVSVVVAHGQMEGKDLEHIMLEFIDGQYDVLVATTIVESGLDIPNVNTIIINDAQNYGLSDLHQLRGRVGRSNRKAFCYLLAPPLSILSTEARKRLKAIEEFSDLGSGFNISMRDLDIRGAGNILGAEQSGFISEIRFEMYQKILDEALQELKQGELRDLLPEHMITSYVADCQIETDLELLIPDQYVSNITERLSLYKELDSVGDERGLSSFGESLVDRFGPVPLQTQDLIKSIRMRWLARDAGFERLVLRQGRMTGYFIQDQQSPYYQSDAFTRILRYVQANYRTCSMKESQDRLSLTFNNIPDIESAIGLLQQLL